jgi:negative regulator of flagellin synthesis FlgM
MPAALKAGPPIDIETVTRIREAIAENRYPIDLNAITESLFQSFLEVSR